MPDEVSDTTGFVYLEVPAAKVARAKKAIVLFVKKFGREEFFAVIEELAFEWGVDYAGTGARYTTDFSELQMIALAEALIARAEVLKAREGK